MQIDKETLRGLNDVPNYHQVDRYVKVPRSAVPFWQQQSKPILHLQDNKASVLKSSTLPTKGKFFVIW